MEKESLYVSEFLELKRLILFGAKQALTMSDAALLTGLSKSYLYKLCHRKSIPHWKSDGGKTTYFSKDELNSWMLKHRVKTLSELEEEATTYVMASKCGRAAK